MTDCNTRNIEYTKDLISAKWLKNKIQLNQYSINLIDSIRNETAQIIAGQSNKLLLVIGPCSIHDYKATLDYAERLSKLASQHKDNILILMRVYFEKSRTNIGWKGFINDPNLDNSYDINKGLFNARDLLFKITQLGLGITTEFIDLAIPQYISDLISYGVIGARTVESQMHRSLASGLAMPIGIKNSTSGDIKSAIDAMLVASKSNCYIGPNEEGHQAIINTKGNSSLQLILRGGLSTGPNYESKFVRHTIEQISKINIKPSIMIDCSHGNSLKNHLNQVKVVQSVMNQLSNTLINTQGRYIHGLMIESFIKAGRQDINYNLKQLEYGKSITDSCLSWEDTVNLVELISEKIENLKKAA